MRHIKGIVATMMLCGSLAVVTPITAFAQTGPEANCICEDKCTEDKINDQCPVCKEDYTKCQGKEAEPTEEAKEPEEEKEEPMGPLTPDGNMNLVDDYGSPDKTGKQFITVTTKNGNYFYIIIDRDDSGNETVHFLNMVDEADLMKLMDEDEQKAYAESIKTKEEEIKPVEETKPVEEEPKEEEPKQEKKGPNAGLLLLLVLGVGGGIGFYFYNKTKGKKPAKAAHDPDIDYSENDDEDDYLDSFDDDQSADDVTDEADEASDDSFDN